MRLSSTCSKRFPNYWRSNLVVEELLSSVLWLKWKKLSVNCLHSTHVFSVMNLILERFAIMSRPKNHSLDKVFDVSLFFVNYNKNTDSTSQSKAMFTNTK